MWQEEVPGRVPCQGRAIHLCGLVGAGDFWSISHKVSSSGIFPNDSCDAFSFYRPLRYPFPRRTGCPGFTRRAASSSPTRGHSASASRRGTQSYSPEKKTDVQSEDDKKRGQKFRPEQKIQLVFVKFEVVTLRYLSTQSSALDLILAFFPTLGPIRADNCGRRCWCRGVQ